MKSNRISSGFSEIRILVHIVPISFFIYLIYLDNSLQCPNIMQIRTSHTRIVYYLKNFLIFCTICLQGAIYLKRYDNFHVARSGVTLYGEAASTNAQNYFRFPLEQFSSPNVTPMWPRNYVYLRRLG